jgi:hypothetical protein
VRLLMYKVPEEKREQVRDTLVRVTGRSRADLAGEKTISFSVDELPPEVVRDMVLSIKADETNVGEEPV